MRPTNSAGLFVYLAAFVARAPAAEVKAPAGFSAELVAGTPAIHFPMFAATDDRGRLFVAESSGLDLYAELSALTRKCRVTALEDLDGDGRYEKATVFADELVFPMGLAWRDGKLYVADPPEVAAFEDTDGDGRADRRTRILGDFGHIDNGSLHGLIFGPDGLLYLTMGSPDGYSLRTVNGEILHGKSGALIRCRPDGTQPQVLSRGFVNLVEVAFLPSGEMIGTDNWFTQPEGGVRDAIVHLVDGGLYPQLPDEGTRYPITGPPLPAITQLPAVALSGLVVHSGNAFPPELAGQVFTAQHNARLVGRHRLSRVGATLRSEDFSFVTCDDPDFHPSDVLEDRDGSLLIVDTGAWYVQHCPTGRIRSSKAPGGIYRVRWQGPTAPTPTKAAELSSAGRLPSSEKALIELLRSSDAPHVRRAAAEALVGAGSPACVPALLGALRRDADRFEEHALVLALDRWASVADLRAVLESSEAPERAQRAALLLLDQPPRSALPREAVVARLGTSNEALRSAVLGALAGHPEWDDYALQAAQMIVRREAIGVEDRAALRALVATSPPHSVVTAWAARSLASPDAQLDSGWRREILYAITELSSAHRGPIWTEALRAVLRSDLSLLGDAVRVSLALEDPALDSDLLRIAKDNHVPFLTRLDALSAAAPRLRETSPEQFSIAADALQRPEPLERLAGAELLARLPLQGAQIAKALDLLGGSALTPPSVLRVVLDRAKAVGAGDVADQWLAAKGRSILDSAAQRADAARARLAELEPLLTGGNPTRGRTVFFSKQTACSTCHKVGVEGRAVGPDLTRIGAVRSGHDLLESIVAPSSTFAQGYEPWTAVLSDGSVHSGVIFRRTNDFITMRNSAGAEAQLRRSAIQSLERAEASIMPEGLDRTMTPEELRDLIAYLQLGTGAY